MHARSAIGRPVLALKVAAAWLDAQAAVLLRDRRARLRDFLGIAESMGELGDWKASESWALRAKRLAVNLQDEREIAHADFQLAHAYVGQGDHERAEASVAHSVAVLRGLGDTDALLA